MDIPGHWSRLEEVRQLASTILYQPARVMIGNRDELKANQDLRARDAVGIVGPFGPSTTCTHVYTLVITCPFFVGGWCLKFKMCVYVFNLFLFNHVVFL